MRTSYDFSAAKKNPYAKQLKQQITIRLDTENISYFKTLATQYHIPYQNLINLYLTDCAQSHKKLSLKWTA
jgi:predicted DNA binding CopG/RHH family protein